MAKISGLRSFQFSSYFLVLSLLFVGPSSNQVEAQDPLGMDLLRISSLLMIPDYYLVNPPGLPSIRRVGRSYEIPIRVHGDIERAIRDFDTNWRSLRDNIYQSQLNHMRHVLKVAVIHLELLLTRVQSQNTALVLGQQIDRLKSVLSQDTYCQGLLSGNRIVMHEVAGVLDSIAAGI